MHNGEQQWTRVTNLHQSNSGIQLESRRAEITKHKIQCRETGGRIVTLIFSNEQNQQECVLLQNTSHMLTYFVGP